MADELLDRVEQIIADGADLDGYGGYSARRQAQAVISGLGLSYVTGAEYAAHGIDTAIEGGQTVVVTRDSRRIEGKWEE